MAEFDDLFNGGLDEKMDFLNDKQSTSNDGIYRVDLTKVKDKKKGWRSIVRLLPNLTKEGTVEQSAIEKITHYVDIKNQRELSGWFDSPKNFSEKCPLTDLYYAMQNSKNAILMEKSKMLKYSKKYYSYVLVIEDEQQPELVGKIMIMQYGKIIKDKISSEKNGEITGVSCNVFDLANGKDLVLIVKEIETKDDETYPDYKMSMFRPESTSIPIYSKEKGIFKNAPVNSEGKFDKAVQNKIKEFLLDREYSLEDYAPKVLTDEQLDKISQITTYLTGKSTTSDYKKESTATSNDFDFEENFTDSDSDENVQTDEDDFFSDL